MSSTPTDRRYTTDHEWIKVVDAAAKKARVGITDYAQKQLGDIVFIELPTQGRTLEASEPFGSIESVKSVAELYLPVGGTITSVNAEISSEPELVNTDPYGDGWLIEITMSDPKEVDGLLTAAKYDAHVAEGDD